MNIEETITQVEKIFENVTGNKLSGTEVRHNMNSQIDPLTLLEMRVAELTQVIQDPYLVQKLQPWTPPISVWENEDKIIVRLDIPAVSKEDIDIALRGNLLVISGNRKNLPQDAGFRPRLVEGTFGHFLRSIVLPFEAMTSDISSSLRDGVLEVTLMKHSQAKVKKAPAGAKTPQ